MRLILEFLASGYSSELTLNELTITGGSGDNGFGIYSYTPGVINIKDCIITNNHVSDSPIAGGVSVLTYISSVISIADSTISGNSGKSGGGIFLKNYYNSFSGSVIPADLTISNSLITGNTTPQHGGGVAFRSFFAETKVSIIDSQISGNIADNRGEDYLLNLYITVHSISLLRTALFLKMKRLVTLPIYDLVEVEVYF